MIELVPYMAHAGHWLLSLAFAVPVLLVPAAAVVAAIDRRRERRDDPSTSR